LNNPLNPPFGGLVEKARFLNSYLGV